MSPNEVNFQDRIRRTVYFFPFQLVLVHLKSNHLLLLFWLFIWGLISKTILSKYGGYNLFLYPEYLGNVDFISHFILGFAFGGFVIAFNIASYVLNGSKFPILATLSKPFAKYCLNNFLIPAIFFLLYFKEMYLFQKYHELESGMRILNNIAGMCFGIFTFLFITFTYFFTTNKSLRKIFGDVKVKKEKNPVRPVRSVFTKKERWYSFLTRKAEWKVITYMSHPFKINLARDISHYDKKMLQTVFAQNHLNASIFEILVILTIIFFSVSRETPIFELPAAASVMLIATVILMLSSAIYSWLKGWATIVFIMVFMGYNYLTQLPKFSFKSFAYGMNYSSERPEYSNARIASINNEEEIMEEDKSLHLDILEKWKKKQPERKPKLLLINASGGGLRASVWTAEVLQHLDSLIGGELMDRTHLITGSSGGLLGAAYYRELYLKSVFQGEKVNRYAPKYIENISKDLLNPVFVSLSLHDWAYGLKNFTYGGYSYRKDRGYAFEQQFIENTNCFHDKKLGDYFAEEIHAEIPLLLMAPTISNDGRRLNISSVPISFLDHYSPLDEKFNFHHESVEFRRLFKGGQADSLRFLTALRMSATFFYVLPSIELPTQPEIEIMDAGIRDNMGAINTLRYIQTFKNWIKENTSGVVVLQIRDGGKEIKIDKKANKSLLSSLVRPIEGVYGNYLSIQEYGQDEIFRFLSSDLKELITVENIELTRTTDDYISLSWHLTKREKDRITKSLEATNNKEVIARLKKVLTKEKEQLTQSAAPSKLK